MAIISGKITPRKEQLYGEGDDVSAQTVVFIAPSVPDEETLRMGVVEGIDVIALSPNQDSVEQITEFLQQHPHTSTIHIVAHGAPGCLYLGNGQLNLGNINDYAPTLRHWPSNLNILLYGCNVAAGDAGEEFIAKLHQLTGANIAASARRLGNAALGGTWELEVTVSQSKILSPLPSQG